MLKEYRKTATIKAEQEIKDAAKLMGINISDSDVKRVKILMACVSRRRIWGPTNESKADKTDSRTMA